MRILFIISWFASLGNAFMQFEKELYTGAAGWLCAAIWLTLLIAKAYKLDKL